MLEIGCGWGGFAEYAARHLKARVTGITISKEQFDYATKRMAEAGLDDLVTIVLKDYRDLDHSYDRIVSIEMFEAVGKPTGRPILKPFHAVLNAAARQPFRSSPSMMRSLMITAGNLISSSDIFSRAGCCPPCLRLRIR